MDDSSVAKLKAEVAAAEQRAAEATRTAATLASSGVLDSLGKAGVSLSSLGQTDGEATSEQ